MISLAMTEEEYSYDSCNDVNLTDTRGFDVLSEISIFPHYTNKKSRLTDEENEERLNKFTNLIINFSKSTGKVIAIPEEDAIYVNNNSIELLGTRPYFTFENGLINKVAIEDNKQIKRRYRALLTQHRLFLFLSL